VSVSQDNRDKTPFLYLGDDGKISPIVSNLPISEALEALISQELEIEKDLPQLALQRLRDNSSNISGVAVRNLYGDAIDVFDELQGNYRSSLKQALQMAISIGAFRRYDGFQSYSIDSYKRGALDFDIKARELFADKLDRRTQLEMTATALSSTAPRLMLTQLDYGDDDIDKALSTAETETELKALAIKKTLGVPDSQLQEEMGYEPNQIAQFTRSNILSNALAFRQNTDIERPSTPIEQPNADNAQNSLEASA
ncbi:MAG: hypothetical protein AAF126_26195, partial [Chloroflexota bacterium]